MSNDSIKLIYIGGDGRSGSTLLERALGQIDGFIAVGELRHIWEKNFVNGELCSCGRPLQQCDFWNAVLFEAFGGYENIPLKHILELKNSVDRIRYIPHMLFSLGERYHLRLVEYSQVLLSLYRAIKKVSGMDIIVDASKDPSTAYILAQIPQIELKLVHLVRDSRAVGYSWQRKRIRPEVVNATEYMATYSASTASMMWLYRNILIQVLKLSRIRYKRIRYEDLVDNITGVLDTVLLMVGESAKAYDFIYENVLSISPGHTVAGNPLRFQKGTISLRLDSEWTRKLSQRDKFLITFLTAPLLYEYHYSLRS